MTDNFFSDSELRDLRETTLEELRELFEGIENLLERFNTRKNGKEDLKGIADLYHTVTGTAGIVGLKDISELASEAEALAGSEDMEKEEAVSKLGDATKRFNSLLLRLEGGEPDNSSREMENE
ncbi:Hpt domain-containing protein [bacterium]